MSGSRLFVAVVVVAAAWFGRGLIAVDSEPDEEPFVPVARHVEAEVADPDWTPTVDGRDPFLPLVLPPAPADAGSPPDG